MFKKIAILAILIGIFITGSLIASERPWFAVELTTHGFANQLDIGYKDVSNNPYTMITWYNVPSGSYSTGFFVDWDDPVPYKVYAEGWGDYGAYDYDDCPANPNQTHYLELWIGCEPPGEEDPPE